MNGEAKPKEAKPKPEEGAVAAALRFWLPVIAIVLIVRTFLFQPFHIPSGSMMATLLVGDSLFVSKFSYGYSRYSLPFINPSSFTGRIFGSQPERGDIVVFRLPKDDSIDYIKRVIGLPGDRIQMINGLLHINDAPVKRQRIVAGLQQSHEAELERRQSTTEAFERYAQTQQISSTINRPVNCITMDTSCGGSRTPRVSS